MTARDALTPIAAASPAEADVRAPRRAHRGRLFRKYLLLILTLVTGALLASGAISVYFSYQENKSALASLQHEKAIAAASRIEQYIRQIEQQLVVCGAAAARCGRCRAAPHRIPEAAAPGAGSHRHRATRRAGTRSHRGLAARHGRRGLGQGSFAGARVSQRAKRGQPWFGPGLFPQGDRALHDDRHPLGQRQRAGHGRGSESQVHLGCRLADQDRRQGQGIRRRRQRVPGRRSRHRPRAAQDQPRASAAREGGAERRQIRRAGHGLDAISRARKC